jgi:hypothetical protein
MPAPPSLVGSLLAGFDATANHIGLLVIPILFDIALWFGPHLRLDQLVNRVITGMQAQIGANTGETADLLQFTNQFWSALVDRLNLFSILRAYPVGIPSLMVSSQPMTTPLGAPVSWQVSSIAVAILLWIVFSVVGLALGAFYFGMVAQVISSEKVLLPPLINDWGRIAIQTFLLAFLLAIFMLALSIPASCLISAVAMGALPFGEIGLWVFGAIALWILLPFIFSPHGIYMNHFTVWVSLRESVRITRATMPMTAIFFVLMLVIDEGLTTLWQIPKDDSWLALVGLVGHAFIATGLVAASFAYYRDANRWLQRVVQQTTLSSGI